MRPLRPVERQWLFSFETLHNTPSREHGVALEDELERRKLTIDYMKSLAARAHLGVDDPNQTAARGVLTVAAILLHRFYMRRSLRDFPEKLLAPTILFLASKIEEEPLKLRYIINAFLSKFYPSAQPWNPASEKDVPGTEYRKWEKEVLATEEVVLETLCFDMGVEQPWVTLRRCLRGLDEIWVVDPVMPSSSFSGESSRQAEERAMESGELGHVDMEEKESVNRNGDGNGYQSGTQKGKGKERFSEELISELCWALLVEANLTPLPILHHPIILAYSTLILAISLITQYPLSRASQIAAEISWKFGLDIDLIIIDGMASITGDDCAEVDDCLKRFLAWCKDGLIDPGLLGYIPPDNPEEQLTPYKHRFQARPMTTPKSPERDEIDKIQIEVPPPVSSASEQPAAVSPGSLTSQSPSFPPSGIDTGISGTWLSDVPVEREVVQSKSDPDFGSPLPEEKSGVDVEMEEGKAEDGHKDEDEDDDDVGSLFGDGGDDGGDGLSPPRYDDPVQDHLSSP